jgi:quercetin dioxygenase-like cupin family protein
LRIFDEAFYVKVDGPETGGAYALIVGSVAPGGGPPLHAHRGPETFQVLSGEFAVTYRDGSGVKTVRGGPGTIVHAPSHAPHRFENVGAERGELLAVVAPETIPFLREFAAAFPPGSTPDMERIMAIHLRHGIEVFHDGDGARPEPAKDDATSAHARALAWRFERANDALIETLSRCTPAQWRAACADSGWTVGVQAHHIAMGEAALAALIGDAAAGSPHPPLPPGKLDEINDRHAIAFAGATLDETLALLREDGRTAARTYRGLTDEQLSRTTTLSDDAPAVTVAAMIEAMAIDEIERHGRFIRDAIAR